MTTRYPQNIQDTAIQKSQKSLSVQLLLHSVMYLSPCREVSCINLRKMLPQASTAEEEVRWRGWRRWWSWKRWW